MNTVSGSIITFALNNLFKVTAAVSPGFIFIILSGSAMLSLIIICYLRFKKQSTLSRKTENGNKDSLEEDENDPLLRNQTA